MQHLEIYKSCEQLFFIKDILMEACMRWQSLLQSLSYLSNIDRYDCFRMNDSLLRKEQRFRRINHKIFFNITPNVPDVRSLKFMPTKWCSTDLTPHLSSSAGISWHELHTSWALACEAQHCLPLLGLCLDYNMIRECLFNFNSIASSFWRHLLTADQSCGGDRQINTSWVARVRTIPSERSLIRPVI